mgnify:CR=1 FL=1
MGRSRTVSSVPITTTRAATGSNWLSTPQHMDVAFALDDDTAALDSTFLEGTSTFDVEGAETRDYVLRFYSYLLTRGTCLLIALHMAYHIDTTFALCTLIFFGVGLTYDNARTLNKMVREAQLAQYNYILVVGKEEEANGTVNVRTRDNQVPLSRCAFALTRL